MALKNKDGTPYRLRGPVPWMRDQHMWDTFALHNFAFKGITIEDDGPTEEVVQGRIGFVEELADLTKTDTLPVAEPVEVVESVETVLPPPAETKKEEMPPAISSMLKNSPNKVSVYCLPGIPKKDDFYGENRGKFDYGEPFTFEGVVVYGDDITTTVWSPTEQVTKGSIIFPQNRDKRWWRVVSRDPKMGGWMLHGTVSDFQPQFRV